MTAAPFCNACGDRFEYHDQYCASCGAGRFSRSDVIATVQVPSDYLPRTAKELFPGYAPAPWSASGTVLTDDAGQIAIYAVSRADAQAALWDLRRRKGSLSVHEYGQTIVPIEAAMHRLDQLIRATGPDQQ